MTRFTQAQKNRAFFDAMESIQTAIKMLAIGLSPQAYVDLAVWQLKIADADIYDIMPEELHDYILPQGN